MDKIIEEANKVYGQYGSEDLDYIAGKLGAEIHETLNTDGLKEVYFPDLRAIVVKPDLPRHERNYLLAHALGHHLFHQQVSKGDQTGFHQELACGNLKMGRLEASPTEREADLFAAYLLVSEVKLRPMLQQPWIKETSDPVLKLALEFQVPVELMMERLIFEGLRR